MIKKPEEEMTLHEAKQAKARTIFQQMQETIRANQARFLNHSHTAKEAKKVYEKATFDLDASIEEEANKKVKPILLKPISALGINRPLEVLGSVLAEQPEEDFEETVVENEPETVEEVPPPATETFLPPDPAETNLDDLIDALHIVSKYFSGVKNEVTFLGDNIHNADYETSDFLHSIELSQFEPEEKIDVFNKVCEIRQRRRSYKERLEYIKELETFLNNNQNITNKIDTLRGQLKRIKEKHKTARFFTKVRNDIKEDDRVHIGNGLLRKGEV